MTMFLVVLSAVLACSVDRFSSHSFSLDTQNPFSYNSQTPSQFLGGELFKHAKSEVQRGMDPFTRSSPPPSSRPLWLCLCAPIAGDSLLTRPQLRNAHAVMVFAAS